MTDLAKDFRAQLDSVARGRRAGDRQRRRSPPTARASGCCGRQRPGHRDGVHPGDRTAARCASRARSAARWTAPSARRRSRGSIATSTTAEIVGQVWLANRELGYSAGRRPHHHERRVHGHGRAARELSQRRAGGPNHDGRSRLRHLAPARDASARRASCRRCYKLAEETNVALAVSLHAPNDELRSELVPINRKHPIAELLDACWHYVDEQNARSVTFEYVMLDGVNDQPEHARELVGLLQGQPAKVNLIPFNPFPGHADTGARSETAIERFRDDAHEGRRDRDDPAHARRRHRRGVRPAGRAASTTARPCVWARSSSQWRCNREACSDDRDDRPNGPGGMREQTTTT